MEGEVVGVIGVGDRDIAVFVKGFVIDIFEVDPIHIDRQTVCRRIGSEQCLFQIISFRTIADRAADIDILPVHLHNGVVRMQPELGIGLRVQQPFLVGMRLQVDMDWPVQSRAGQAGRLAVILCKGDDDLMGVRFPFNAKVLAGQEIAIVHADRTWFIWIKGIKVHCVIEITARHGVYDHGAVQTSRGHGEHDLPFRLGLFDLFVHGGFAGGLRRLDLIAGRIDDHPGVVGVIFVFRGVGDGHFGQERVGIHLGLVGDDIPVRVIRVRFGDGVRPGAAAIARGQPIGAPEDIARTGRCAVLFILFDMDAVAGVSHDRLGRGVDGIGDRASGDGDVRVFVQDDRPGDVRLPVAHGRVGGRRLAVGGQRYPVREIQIGDRVFVRRWVLMAGDADRVAGLLDRAVMPAPGGGQATQFHIGVVLDRDRLVMNHGRDGQAKRLTLTRIQFVINGVGLVRRDRQAAGVVRQRRAGHDVGDMHAGIVAVGTGLDRELDPIQRRVVFAGLLNGHLVRVVEIEVAGDIRAELDILCIDRARRVDLELSVLRGQECLIDRAIRVELDGQLAFVDHVLALHFAAGARHLHGPRRGQRREAVRELVRQYAAALVDSEL